MPRSASWSSTGCWRSMWKTSTLEQVRWVVLMVLSSQPGQEQACARMETLVFDSDSGSTH